MQWADYGEAWERFERGGEETYFGQKYTVQYVSDVAARDCVAEVTVLSAATDLPDRVLSNGVRVRGLQVYPPQGRARHRDIVAAVAQTRPTHLTVAMPLPPVLGWGVRNGARVLPLLADSFHADGLKAWLKHLRLKRMLNDPKIEVVSNHGLAASLDLVRIGVAADKVVPFDWPALISAADFPAKSAPGGLEGLRVVYVGQLIEAKGVADAIRALRILTDRQGSVHLTLVGQGDAQGFGALADSLGLSDNVTFAGLLPHPDVLELLRRSHIALVPSHHDYPEGLPMTLYEAMCTRTPLVASDHPMFARKIRDGENALVFRAGDPADLADKIIRLATDGVLYERMSDDYAVTTETYLCPLKWGDLLDCFLFEDNMDRLRRHAISRDGAVPSGAA